MVRTNGPITVNGDTRTFFYIFLIEIDACKQLEIVVSIYAKSNSTLFHPLSGFSSLWPISSGKCGDGNGINRVQLSSFRGNGGRIRRCDLPLQLRREIISQTLEGFEV